MKLHKARIAGAMAAAVVLSPLIVTAPAFAAASCSSATSSDLTVKVIATQNATVNPVYATPQHSSPKLGILTPGARYLASSVLSSCSDGFIAKWRAVQVTPTSPVGFVNAGAVALDIQFADVDFGRQIQSAGGLLAAKIYSSPSATSKEIGKLESGTTYRAGIHPVAGQTSLSGSGQFTPIDLGGHRLGWVDEISVVTAKATGDDRLDATNDDGSEIPETKFVVTKLGEGQTVYALIGAPDLSSKTQPLAGRGKKLGTVHEGDLFDGLAPVYKPLQLSVWGAAADALTSDASTDPELKASIGTVRLIDFDGQRAWISGTAVSEKQSLISKAKEKAKDVAAATKRGLEKAKDKAKALTAGAKTKINEHRKARGPGLLTWLQMLPAGIAAILALIFAGIAWRGPRGFLRLVPARIRGVIATLAGAVAVLAAFLAGSWLPASAPIWVAGALIVVSAVTAAALHVGIRRARGRMTPGALREAATTPMNQIIALVLAAAAVVTGFALGWAALATTAAAFAAVAALLAFCLRRDRGRTEADQPRTEAEPQPATEPPVDRARLDHQTTSQEEPSHGIQ